MINFILNFGPWLWVCIFIACCVIEAFTLGLTTIWCAIAALPMIFICKTGLPFKWQLLVFAIFSIGLIIFTRPFAVKKLKMGKEKTNVDSVIGQEVLIVKSVSKFEKGQAKAKNGVVWTATSDSESEILENTICKIVSVNGNTISVEPVV